MTDFLIYRYFKGFCKGRKNLVSAPRYTKKLRAMSHSAELRLRAMPHSAEFRLRAMLHSAEFEQKLNSKMFLPTPLCGTAGSRLRAMPHSGGSQFRAMRHSGELQLRAMRRRGVDFRCRIKSNFSANSNLYAKPF
jgi:hypothetical protein